MKKIGIITILFILTFSFSVKAEVFMEIDCNSKNITSEKGVTCEGNLVYEEVRIDDISFEYTTNLDVEFLSLQGFSLNKNGNKVSIHSSTTLYDEIMDSRVIMKFNLKSNNSSSASEKFILKNIRINNSNDTIIDDVTEEFKVDVTKPLDSNCNLNSITVDKVSVPNFDKDKLEYKDIIVNKNVVFIDAVRSSEKSSATGLGDVFIKPGETLEHKIEVVAEDNTKKVYKLFITNKNSEESTGDVNSIGMELSSDNTLKSLELYNGKEKIPFTYNSKKDTFDINIFNSELERITIKATLNHDKATFVDKFGPRDVSVKMGSNKVLIKTKAENNTEKTYTLNINLKESKSSDNTLSSLKINDEVINLIDNVFEYDIVLPKDTSKTKIETVANNEKANVEYKDIDLVDGDNKVLITVTAENGDKKEYHVNVIRSDKGRLNDIKVDGYSLGFSLSEKDYLLKIDNDDNELKIIVSPSNIDYKIAGNNNLEKDSVIKITVTDANGTNEYKITILKDNDGMSIVVYIIIFILAIAIVIAIIYEIKKKMKENNPVIEEI